MGCLCQTERGSEQPRKTTDHGPPRDSNLSFAAVQRVSMTASCNSSRGHNALDLLHGLVAAQRLETSRRRERFLPDAENSNCLPSSRECPEPTIAIPYPWSGKAPDFRPGI